MSGGIKDKDLMRKLKKIGVNYVTSEQPVGEEIEEEKNDIKMVSAGHEKHEWTSFTAMEKIFEDWKQSFATKDEL